jgi:hypothetical protein
MSDSTVTTATAVDTVSAVGKAIRNGAAALRSFICEYSCAYTLCLLKPRLCCFVGPGKAALTLMQEDDNPIVYNRDNKLEPTNIFVC